MASITDTLQQSMTPGMIQKISQSLGVDPQTAQQGIQVALPLLVTALSRNASTPQGAKALSNALQQHDGTVLAHMDSAVTNPNTSDASGILSHVLGSNQGEIERTVSAGTGLDAGMLLQILAPLVMGALGKQMRDRQMNPGQVAGALQNEQQQYQQSNGGLMSAIYAMIDSNKDGSIFDEVSGMLGSVLAQQRKQ